MTAMHLNDKSVLHPPNSYVKTTLEINGTGAVRFGATAAREEYSRGRRRDDLPRHASLKSRVCCLTSACKLFITE